MTAQALLADCLPRLLLSPECSQDAATNVIERAVELDARVSLGSIPEVVDRAYASVDPTDRRAVGLRWLREVAAGAQLASAYERGAWSLELAHDVPRSSVRSVMCRAFRLGRFDDLASALPRLGDDLGSVLPIEDLDAWGDLRLEPCATLLSALGVRHPLVFTQMALRGQVSALASAAQDALAVPPSSWNGGRKPPSSNGRWTLPWAYESIAMAAAGAGLAELGFDLASALPDPGARCTLQAEVARAAARKGDPSFATRMIAAGLAPSLVDSHAQRLHAWNTLASTGGDVLAAAKRMRPRVRGTCMLANELAEAHRGADAALVLSTLAGTRPRDFHDYTISLTVWRLCDAGDFAKAAELGHSTPYVALRAAWGGHLEMARRLDADGAAALDPLLSYMEGQPVRRIDVPIEKASMSLLFELEQQHGRSIAVVQGTAGYPKVSFRLELLRTLPAAA